MVSMILMFIGGSPMGTAGGVKTNYGCSSYRAGYFLYPWKS